MISRGLQFSIISVSIYFNYEYYKDKFLSHIVYIVFGIVVFSFFLDPFIFSGRYMELFGTKICSVHLLLLLFLFFY